MRVTPLDATFVAVRAIPQRELRNDIARVLRDVESGEAVQVTVRGRVVAELHPPRRRALTPAGVALRTLRGPSDPGWLEDLLAERERATEDERDVWA